MVEAAGVESASGSELRGIDLTVRCHLGCSRPPPPRPTSPFRRRSIERRAADVLVDLERALDGGKGALLAIHAIAQAAGDADRHGRGVPEVDAVLARGSRSTGVARPSPATPDSCCTRSASASRTRN